VISVSFARQAHELLERTGFDVDYRESDVVHTIDPADIPRAAGWLERVLPA
jgi:predicted esterase